MDAHAPWPALSVSFFIRSLCLWKMVCSHARTENCCYMYIIILMCRNECECINIQSMYMCVFYGNKWQLCQVNIKLWKEKKVGYNFEFSFNTIVAHCKNHWAQNLCFLPCKFKMLLSRVTLGIWSCLHVSPSLKVQLLSYYYSGCNLLGFQFHDWLLWVSNFQETDKNWLTSH